MHTCILWLVRYICAKLDDQVRWEDAKEGIRKRVGTLPPTTGLKGDTITGLHGQFEGGDLQQCSARKLTDKLGCLLVLFETHTYRHMLIIRLIMRNTIRLV
jgi:hypothetical protein